MRNGCFLRFDDQSGTPLLHGLHQQERGSVSGAVGDQLHALGLQSVGAQGAHHIGQPLRPVAQSKAAAVFEKTGSALHSSSSVQKVSLRNGPASCPLPTGK